MHPNDYAALQAQLKTDYSDILNKLLPTGSLQQENDRSIFRNLAEELRAAQKHEEVYKPKTDYLKLVK